MSDPSPILSLQNVTVSQGSEYDIGLSDVSLTLGPGELALVLLQRPYFHLPLADVASGLLRPDAGTVVFRSKNQFF